LIDISKSFTSMGCYPQFIDNTKILAQRLDRLELHEINRYEDTDKELKTIIISTINIKIQNIQIKSKFFFFCNV
jgi:hypothetical protein